MLKNYLVDNPEAEQCFGGEQVAAAFLVARYLSVKKTAGSSPDRLI